MAQAERYRKAQDRQRVGQENFKYREFTYEKLEMITSNFRRVLGSGSFGTVYHGCLKNGDQVAVKFLINSSTRDTHAFIIEARLLSNVHHNNLVSLIGYCCNKQAHALVYEYMPGGNLLDRLNDNSGERVLSWLERARIAYEAAQGLQHLHTGGWPVIVHRDVKARNILLSHTLEAKIHDFGMSKTYQNDYHRPSSSVVHGTPGYIDPEYRSGRDLTEKSDVYSFGVVLLELVTGKPPILPPPVESHISEWVKSRIDWADIKDVADARFNGDYSPDSVRSVIRIATQCTESESTKRPSMAQVVAQLKRSWELQVTWHRNSVRSRVPTFKQVWRMLMAGIRTWWLSCVRS